MKLFLYFISVIAMGAVLVACGPSIPDPVSIDLEVGNEFAYSATELSAPTGAEVTINMNNTGGLEHNWVLVAGNKDPYTVTEDDALFEIKSETAAPGQVTSFQFVAPEPGSYQYVCSIPGHAAGGMFGTIEITP